MLTNRLLVSSLPLSLSDHPHGGGAWIHAPLPRNKPSRTVLNPIKISDMADPTSIVPYHDPYENHDFLNMMNLADLPPDDPSIRYPSPRPYINGTNINGIADADDPLDDPIIWELCNGQTNTSNNNNRGCLQTDNNAAGTSGSVMGQSEIGGETSNGGVGEEGENVGRENAGNGDGNGNGYDFRLLAVWPAEPVPFWCSCCHVLREIVHTNGQQLTKLEIHGRLGMICHAILEIQEGAFGPSPSGKTHQMFDFCRKSTENVKEFLVQYCDDRKHAGFVMWPDPLAGFYEALCVGLDWDDTWSFDGFDGFDDFSEPCPNDLGTNQMNNQPETEAGPSQMDYQPQPENASNLHDEPANGNVSNPNHDHQQETENSSNRRTAKKKPLSVQRARMGKLSVKDVGVYFHLPIEQAARMMELCPTAVKKICRRDGLTRWPHRKIKSLEKKITSLMPQLNSYDAEARANAQAELQKLEQELANIFVGVNI